MRLPAWLRSTTARIVLAIFLLQAASAAAVLLALRAQTQAELARETRDRIVETRDDLMARYYDGGAAGLSAMIGTRLSRSPDPRLLLALEPASGARAGNLAQSPPDLRDGGWATLDIVRRGGAGPEAAILTARRLPDGSRLVVGHVLAGDARLTRAFEAALAGTIAIALILSVASALVIGRLIGGRTRRIARTARAIGAGDLAARVDRDGSGDGFDALGQELNAMAERTELLVGELRIMSDSLAHDLRSPITRLHAVIGRALADTGDARARAALAEVEGEADSLLAMLSTALEISRAEARVGADRMAPLALAPFIADFAEMYGPLAEDRGIALSVDALPVTVSAHRELLARAVANLIDNAIKYGDRAIALSVAREGDRALLRVADDGPGIPPEERAAALRRFGRLDAARGTPGAGLGLTLVAAVAHLHGGTLELGDNRPGLVATIGLPLG
ncbi:HAMP domain-containing sensor histidine kinase [uncultured Sphingomonas sp.]|uniref:sensor histidine kinase n=1 Tax=uncultured Sphingomonas sp. TaxID=158754 RepID=UPI00261BE4BD|nr:HAMP domain-containing sensor histidine kinase [uncultured Sphingomonas sp.]